MRPIARLIPLLALATTLSCADMPIAPRGIVTVTGLITDRDGPGIEQVHIEFYSLDPRDQTGGQLVVAVGSPRSAKVNSSTVTDGTGHYRLSLPAGPYMVFLEPERGYPYVLMRKVDISPGHTEVNYHYTGVRISGTMKGPNGLPLTQASVVVYGSGPDNTSASSDLVGDRYSLLVPAGTYLVRAGAFGTFGLPAIRSQLSVARDTTIDFVLDGILVTGSVRGQNGVPLERIRVIAASSPSEEDIYTYTLGDGTYTMYLPAATYLWRLIPWFDSMSYIAGRDYPPVAISAPTTLDFDMSGVEWSGTVRRASDSTAVSNADVAALELRSDYSYNAAQARSDGAGQFRLIVGRGLYYNLFVEYGARPVGTFATSADSTFNIYVDAPPLP